MSTAISVSELKPGDNVRLKDDKHPGYSEAWGLRIEDWREMKGKTFEISEVKPNYSNGKTSLVFKNGVKDYYWWNYPAMFFEKVEKKESTSVVSKRKDDVKMSISGRKAKKKVAKKKISKKRTNGYTVRALIKNGAAEKAGICIGDTIISVDGKSTAARGALGSALKNFKKGAKVSVRVEKLDGRKSFIKVTLGGNKAGRATLGVISGKKKAAAYNTKLNTAKIKLAKSTKKTVDEVLEPSMNEFEARAAEEMKAAAALMADMKGRDALLKARNLRRELQAELKKGSIKNADMVNEYLDKLRADANADFEKKPEKRKLSKLGKFVFAIAGLSAISGIGVGIAHVAGIL